MWARPQPGRPNPVAWTGERSLVRNLEDRTLQCFDGEGRLLWRRPADNSTLVRAPGRLLSTAGISTRVVCIDAESGEDVWTREVPSGSARVPSMETNSLAQAPDALTVHADRVVAVTIDRRVLALSLDSGELLGCEAPPLAGWFCVHGSTMYFHDPGSLSEFDVFELRETRRTDVLQAVKPLYGNRPVTSLGFAVSRDSVVWTTASGMLMAVSREAAPDGSRVTWSTDIGGAQPAGTMPVLGDNHLYVSTFGAKPALVCFAGEPSAGRADAGS